MRQIQLLAIFLLVFISCNNSIEVKHAEYNPFCTEMFIYDTLDISIKLKKAIKLQDVDIYLNNKDYAQMDSYLKDYGMNLSEDNILSFTLYVERNDYPYSLHLEILDRQSERIIYSDISQLDWKENGEGNGQGCGYQYKTSLVLSE